MILVAISCRRPMTPNTSLNGCSLGMESPQRPLGNRQPKSCRNSPENLRKFLPSNISYCFFWRPQGDSNPCYRRERALRSSTAVCIVHASDCSSCDTVRCRASLFWLSSPVFSEFYGSPGAPAVARLSRDARIETREARSRLKQRSEPYWRQLQAGLVVGYRKGARPASGTCARGCGRRTSRARSPRLMTSRTQTGWTCSTMRRRSVEALDRANLVAQTGAGRTTPSSRRCRLYDWYRGHRKAADATQAAVDAHILPALGSKHVGRADRARAAKMAAGHGRCAARAQGTRKAL